MCEAKFDRDQSDPLEPKTGLLFVCHSGLHSTNWIEFNISILPPLELVCNTSATEERDIWCYFQFRMHIRCALGLSTCRRIEFREQHETKINVCFEFHAQTGHTVSYRCCYNVAIPIYTTNEYCDCCRANVPHVVSARLFLIYYLVPYFLVLTPDDYTKAFDGIVCSVRL